MAEPIYAGGCLCGALRYRAVGTARNLCYCHCRSCRLASGAPFVAWATFASEGFQWVAGAPTLVRSSDRVRRGFCSGCGCAITYSHLDRPDEFDLAVATVDRPDDLAPLAHIWFSHRLPWVDPPDGLPRYPEWPKRTGEP